MMKTEKQPGKQNGDSSNRYFLFFEKCTEVLAWFAIVISLSALSALVAFACYLFIPGDAKQIIAMIVLATGIILSIIYACYIWRTTGTLNLISNSSWKNNRTAGED